MISFTIEGAPVPKGRPRWAYVHTDQDASIRGSCDGKSKGSHGRQKKDRKTERSAR